MINKQEHRIFNYPTGTKTIMQNYKRTKPRKTKQQKKISKRHAIKRKFSKNKYNAHKTIIDSNKFDSKTEAQYYLLLKAQHAHFKCHQRFEILPHQQINQIKCRKRNYTCDFAIYNKYGDLKEVDDVKGVRQIPSYDTLRFSLFERKYKVPVKIVRKKRGHFYKQTKQF